MDRDDLREIKFFSEREIAEACENRAWENVRSKLMFSLENLREINGGPVYLNYLWATSGHSRNSRHYTGEAADVVLARWRRRKDLPLDFPKRWIIKSSSQRVLIVRPLFEQWVLALKIPAFNGIGAYPHWKRPGVHVDIQPTNLKSTWWRNSKKAYLGVSGDFPKFCS